MEFPKWVKGAVTGAAMMVGVNSTEAEAQDNIAKDLNGLLKPTVTITVPIKDAPGLTINQTVFQGAENLVVPTEEEIMATAKSLKDFTRMHKIVAQKHPGVAASYQMNQVPNGLKKMVGDGSYGSRIDLLWFLSGLGIHVFPSDNPNSISTYGGTGEQNIILEKNLTANAGLFKVGDLSREDAMKWKVVK